MSGCCECGETSTVVTYVDTYGRRVCYSAENCAERRRAMVPPAPYTHVCRECGSYTFRTLCGPCRI